MNRSDFENWLKEEFFDECLITSFRVNARHFLEYIEFRKDIRKDKVTYQEVKEHMEENKELILLKLL